MVFSAATFEGLKEMGIQLPQAREAATRFSDVMTAVEWCFGAGQDWTAPLPIVSPSMAQAPIPGSPIHTRRPRRIPDPDDLPEYTATSSASAHESHRVTVEHREVQDDSPDSSDTNEPNTPPATASSHLPSTSETTPRAPQHHPSTFKAITSTNPFHVNLPDVPKAPPSIFANPDQQFGDKNPFATHRLAPPLPPRDQNRSKPFQPNLSPHSSAVTVVDSEDDDLAKAIALSKADAGMDISDGEKDERQMRERSVRASGAPPPSPEPEGKDEGEVMQTLFGPSEKDDKDGNMAMVTTTPAWTSNTEDDDYNRAIQDSLLTASYHSASALREVDKPEKKGREPGAPIVLYSESGRSTYAANYLQAILVIPQLKELILSVTTPNLEIEALQQLIQETGYSNVNYVEVDEVLKTLRSGREPSQLPPANPVIELHTLIRTKIVSSLHGVNSDHDSFQGITPDVLQVYNSQILSEPPQSTTHVKFLRDVNFPSSLYPMLASLLWTPENPGQSILELSDLLCFSLGWGYGAPREVWDVEERIVLDRFLKRNAAWSTQIRAQQGVSQGNARRLKDRLEHLTMHKGNNYQDSLSTLIKHLEQSTPNDEIQAATYKEMREKLENTLAVLKLKVEELQLELEVEEKAATGALFDTTSPELNQHVFTLKAILFHDGALVAGNHLYMYVRQDDGCWWKIQGHEASKVEWEAIRTDKTGLYMDGGPYFFFYSREGPRPPTPESEISLLNPPSSSTEPLSTGPSEAKDVDPILNEHPVHSPDDQHIDWSVNKLEIMDTLEHVDPTLMDDTMLGEESNQTEHESEVKPSGEEDGKDVNPVEVRSPDGEEAMEIDEKAK